MARCSGDRRASGDDWQPDGCHGPRRDRVRRRCDRRVQHRSHRDALESRGGANVRLGRVRGRRPGAADHPGGAEGRAQRGAGAGQGRWPDLLRDPQDPQGQHDHRRTDRHQRADRRGGRGDRLGQRLPPDRGRRRGQALYGRTSPGGTPSRQRGRRYERAARPGIGARPHRGQPARADQRRRGRLRAHRGRHAPPGQRGQPAGPAARENRNAVHQPGRRADGFG